MSIENEGRFSNRGEMDPLGFRNEMPRTSSLDVIGELAARMKKLEAEHAELKAMVNEAKDRGDIGFNVEHAAHILNKHFFHDQPAPPATPERFPKFDAFTGQPLN